MATRVRVHPGHADVRFDRLIGRGSWTCSLVISQPWRLDGYKINAENTATHYHSGQEFDADFVAAQHLPMGFIFGAARYALQQTTADSGSGAIFGPYEGRVLALGPLLGKTCSLPTLRSG